MIHYYEFKTRITRRDGCAHCSSTRTLAPLFSALSRSEARTARNSLATSTPSRQTNLSLSTTGILFSDTTPSPTKLGSVIGSPEDDSIWWSFCLRPVRRILTNISVTVESCNCMTRVGDDDDEGVRRDWRGDGGGESTDGVDIAVRLPSYGARKGVRATGSDGASFYGTVGVLASDLPRPSLFLLTDTKATRDNRDIGQWTGRTRHRPVVVVVQRRRDTNNSQASRGSHKDRINQRLSAIGQAGVVPDGPRQGTAVGWHSLKKVFLVFWPQELSGVSYIFGVF